MTHRPAVDRRTARAAPSRPRPVRRPSPCHASHRGVVPTGGSARGPDIIFGWQVPLQEDPWEQAIMAVGFGALPCRAPLSGAVREAPRTAVGADRTAAAVPAREGAGAAAGAGRAVPARRSLAWVEAPPPDLRLSSAAVRLVTAAGAWEPPATGPGAMRSSRPCVRLPALPSLGLPAPSRPREPCHSAGAVESGAHPTPQQGPQGAHHLPECPKRRSEEPPDRRKGSRLGFPAGAGP